MAQTMEIMNAEIFLADAGDRSAHAGRVSGYLRGDARTADRSGDALALAEGDAPTGFRYRTFSRNNLKTFVKRSAAFVTSPSVTGLAVAAAGILISPEVFAAGADPVSAAVTKAGTTGVSMSIASLVIAGVGVGCGVAFGGGGVMQRGGLAVLGGAIGAGSPAMVTAVFGTAAGFGLQTLIGV